MTASTPSPDQLRRLRVLSSRLVTGLFAGEYRSVFRGRGMEFESVREYQPGDDVRHIDWNVTARAGRPFLKQFVEERELNLMLLVDRSASLACPTPRGAKSRLAAEAASLLAFAAVRSNDRVGLITCSDRVESFIPPAKGARQAQRIVASLCGGASSGRGSDLAGALEYLARASRRACTLCIVSDFICPDFSRELAALARRHETVALVVTDPSDFELPNGGLLDLTDEESGRRTLIDSASPKVRRFFREAALERRARLLETFGSLGVKQLVLSTTEPPLHALVRFFQGNRRQGRR
uniref:VWFA domain-containing protein n=1 Tax=Geobacter sp. (strain M21) TaxID=443144 RepID=C6DZU0_GEOSM